MVNGATAGGAPHHAHAQTATRLHVDAIALQVLMTTDGDGGSIPAVEAQHRRRVAVLAPMEEPPIEGHVPPGREIARQVDLPGDADVPRRELSYHCISR